MNISTEEQARLQKLSKKLKVKFTVLSKEYIEELARLTEAKTEGNINRLAVNSVMNRHRRQMKRAAFVPKNPPIGILGFLAGDAGLRDKAEEMREKVKRKVDKEGLQLCQDLQMVDGDNNVLDQRQKIYGKPNANYQKPLPRNLKLQQRTVFGFFKKVGTPTFKYGSLHTENNKLARAWNQVPMFTPFQTMAILREQTPTFMTLTSSSGEKTMTVFKKLNEDWGLNRERLNKIIMDTLAKQFTPIGKVPDHFKTFKDAWNRKIFVRGVASWIGLERPTPWNSIWIGLMDSDLGFEAEQQVRILVPEHIGIDFGEQSEIIVFGKDRINYNRDRDTGKRIPGDTIIDAYGIWPIPGLTTPKLSSKLESLEDETEIEGWLS